MHVKVHSCTFSPLFQPVGMPESPQYTHHMLYISSPTALQSLQPVNTTHITISYNCYEWKIVNCNCIVTVVQQLQFHRDPPFSLSVRQLYAFPDHLVISSCRDSRSCGCTITVQPQVVFQSLDVDAEEVIHLRSARQIKYSKKMPTSRIRARCRTEHETIQIFA